MSKRNKPFLIFFTVCLLILHTYSDLQAQSIEATISIDPGLHIADVRGRFLDAGTLRNPRNFYFASSAGSEQNLGERISNVKLTRADGTSVDFRQLIPGEFLASGNFETWSYRIRLTPPKNRNASAHLSWIGARDGLIMLDDLLPRLDQSGTVNAKVVIEIPSGWPVFSSERKNADGQYEITDAGDAVFLIGRAVRSTKADIGGVSLTVNVSGEWLFTETEAAAMAAEIYSEYRKIFGAAHGELAQISLVHFPVETQPGNWQAETRGRNVTIVSSDMNFRTQSLQRLHEQLRHEILHLWLPNAVNLTGNYDWFYEGFALYQSLKTGVLLNRIGFDDFLDTLSRAYAIDVRQIPRISLIEASKSRFGGSDTQIYARGMLVAFLSDISLLEQSKGKKSNSDLLRSLFEKHRRPKPSVDGNRAVIENMRVAGVRPHIIENYIEGNQPIEWNNELKAAGISPPNAATKSGLAVISKPNGRQKALLHKLGYNSWRKLSAK